MSIVLYAKRNYGKTLSALAIQMKLLKLGARPF